MQSTVNKTVYSIELKNVSKYFGRVIANEKISLSVKKGEILSLLGENGSGKTTLMNMLSGIYFPDEGSILIDGKEVVIRSPKDARDHGIGMIHQHFKLIDVFTASQNIILGLPGKNRLNMKEISRKIQALADRYGFSVVPDKKVYNMSVSEKQTVEILKVLYRGADILILDEPTAVLTPQEAERLFSVLRNMRNDGKSIIIITHKLREVMDLSDRVAVLRGGENVGTVETKDATEYSLTEMMVGKKISLDIERKEPENRKIRLSVKNLTCADINGKTTLDDVSFEVFSGEILGIAGITGSGQKELLESIAGIQKIQSGTVHYYAPRNDGLDEKKREASGEPLVGKTPLQIRNMGVALSFVPEDRLGMGLVGSMDMAGNMMIRSYREGRSFFVNRKEPIQKSKRIIDELEVVPPDLSAPIRQFSGGNVQKVLVGREIASSPTVLMTAYAVRGLDINTSYTIYRLLNAEKESGAAVLYVGEDLDVLLALCDRIMVLCGGRVTGMLDARTATKEKVGLLMTGYGKEGDNQ